MLWFIKCDQNGSGFSQGSSEGTGLTLYGLITFHIRVLMATVIKLSTRIQTPQFVQNTKKLLVTHTGLQIFE